MKISLTQENLSKALGLVSRAVSNRSSLPVLSNVLLSTESKRLRLSATNLEVGINYWLGCKIEEEGSITVPSRLFNEFVSSLPGGNIELSTNDLVLSVKTPHYESTINGISADEFPLIPEVKSPAVLSLDADALREALAQVVVAASLDEARPVLAGVYIYTEGSELVLVATDSYRLAEKRLKIKGDKPDKLSVIVPARTIQELVRVLTDGEGVVEVFLNENQVMFRFGDVELTSRLIEGQFPDYKKIIPTKSETGFEISSEEFGRITKVASLFARENAGSIRIEIDPGGTVSIISTASQVGENKSSADCEALGGDGDISLNAKYLTDALGAIKSQEVRFEISGKLNPCVITPVSEKAEDYIHIIMPLRT